MRSLLLTSASVFAVPAIAFALTFDNSAVRYADERDFSPAERVAVSVLTSINAVEGNPDGTYRPRRTLNRAEFTKIVLRSAPRLRTELPLLKGKTCFPDVKQAQWFSVFVCAAKEKNILQGYPDGTFKPEREVNYAEALKILVNLYDYLPAGAARGEAEPWYAPFARAAEERKVVLPERPPYGHILTRGEMARLAAAFLAEHEGKLQEYREKEGFVSAVTGGPIQVRDGYFPVFVRNVYFLEHEKPAVLDAARRGGVNTLTLGFFQTGAFDPAITSLEAFKAANANDIATFKKYSDEGWYIIGQGDQIGRTQATLNWILTTPWSAQALGYIFEKFAAIPRVLGIDLMDEPNYVYLLEDPENPPPGFLGSIGLPDDAFIKLREKINTARVKPRLGWNTRAPQWVQYIGDWASVENHAEGCLDPIMNDFVACARRVRDAMWKGRSEKGDTERIPLVLVTNALVPGYEKWNPGGLYTQGKDRRVLIPGASDEDLYAVSSMHILTAATLGFAGARVYFYDPSGALSLREQSLLSGVYAWTPGGRLFRTRLDRSWEPIGSPPASLPEINALFAYGGIYVGTKQGMYLPAGERMDVWTRVEGTQDRNVLSFGADAFDSRLYVGTDRGLFSYQPTVEQVSGIPPVRIHALTQRGWIQEPGMYVGTEGKGLYVVRDGKGRKVQGIPDVTVHALYVGHFGTSFFAGTSDGIYTFNFDEKGSEGTIRHLLPGVPVYSFLEQPNLTIGVGTEKGYYEYVPFGEEEERMHLLSAGMPGPVTHLAYVSNAGMEGDAWIHARTPSGIYVATLDEEGVHWTKDAGAPANTPGLIFISSPQQMGFREDGAPNQRRMWETITRTFKLMEELEPKLLTPVIREEFPQEGAAISVRKGDGWQLLIAVNGTAAALEVDPSPFLDATAGKKRARLIRGPNITEKPYGKTVIPPWGALVVEAP